MKFIDLFVNREEMFSMGIEELSGQYYVSFPVSLGVVDYEEYYAIDRATFERFEQDLPAALAFVTRARRRELDQLLIIQPGKNRGTA
ncbi:uncharacterized protein POS17_6059 [Pseudomonas sp. Os17]|uniref:hypothetical protein n=1 Tax=unclassified Pseudomonas TaxID=196821 RepID=UPI0005FC5505|nr:MULTISPECIES: hypothetical protein [unclassified Pseudomonas]ULT70888.1 hypothetical protein L1O02_00540 [Pseudomonas sp. BC42]BAQ77753.1 uncharacterized protein POS17_6059 [Pseudomonas sp. Os17]